MWSLLTACGGAGAPVEPVKSEVVVLAASSLTEAFTALEASFEAAHPDAELTLSFAGSQALATQIRHGHTADVFASADAEHALALAQEGLLEAPRPFATNGLVLAQPPASTPLSLETLAQAERIVLAGTEVPAGRYADALLTAARTTLGDAWYEGVQARIASREPNVRLVLAKVAMGEADAAIVYATDVPTAPGVVAVELPAALAPPVVLVHGRVASGTQPDLAQAWLAHVEGPAGREALGQQGFGFPE